MGYTHTETRTAGAYFQPRREAVHCPMCRSADTDFDMNTDGTLAFHCHACPCTWLDPAGAYSTACVSAASLAKLEYKLGLKTAPPKIPRQRSGSDPRMRRSPSRPPLRKGPPAPRRATHALLLTPGII